MAAIRAFAAGIQTPAIGAILPQIVPEEMLTKINGINGTIQAMLMFISPVVSAALLDIATMEMIFMIDVVTAALAIAVLLILKVPTHYKAAAEEMNSYFTDFM